MTKSQLQQQYVKVLGSSLNKNSKFYAEDLNGIKKAASKKTESQLKESIARWNAINNVTQVQINANCQFGGLQKLGK